MDDFEASGRWWLPESEGNRCPGTLTLDRTQFALAVDAPLTPLPAMSVGQVFADLWEPREHPVIYGELRDGTAVTLTDAHGLATMLPVSEGTEVWRPRTAFLGAHLTDLDNTLFENASVALTGLRAFAGNPSAGFRWEHEERTGKTSYAMAEARRRVLQSAAVPGAGLELLATPTLGMTAGRGEVGVDVTFEIKCDEPRSWSQIWSEQVLPLRDLLTILLDRSVDVCSLRLTGPGAEPGRLLLRLAGLPDETERAITPHDFLLNADTLPGGFDQAVPAWMRFRQHSLKAVSEYTDVVASPHMYADDRLVGMVRAVGPLCDDAAKGATEELANVEYTRWLAEVSAALPDHLRDAVVGRLTPPGPNERHRLIALLDSLGPVGTWLAGGNAPGYAQRVIATRNGIAHPSRTPKNMLADRALVVHMAQLGWIVRAVMLNRMGMSLDDVAQLLQGTTAASYVDELAAPVE